MHNVCNMDRKIRSAIYGPAGNGESNGAAKFFAAAGAFFRKNKSADHRVVRRRQSTIVLRDLPKSEDELEAEELERLEDLEAWHRIVREVAALHRAQEHFEEIVEQHEVEQMIAEAYALMREINEADGWEPGEPAVADRMFGTNVRAMLAEAKTTGKITFRTKKAIDVMRSVGHSASVSKSKIASVAAVRNLVGGVTNNEAQLLEDERRLKADDFAEYVGFADRLSRAEEIAIASRLGRAPAPPTARDLDISVADGHTLHRKDRQI